MRALIQRVSRAQVAESGVPNKNIADIEKGLVILAAFEDTDSPVIIEQMAQKIKSLRIFSDAAGKMNHAGTEVGARYLLTSQFTLFAECKYGNRPSFDKAAGKARAKEYYEHFAQTMQRIMGSEYVQWTPFGSDLQLELVNDGPVTIWLDSTEVL
jgi:D-tyrosyl-tRNA(Tyr) deacylase